MLKATQDNPLKNDFVLTCKKYMKILGIEFSFEQIEQMSKASLKKVLKEKTRQAAYKYLIDQKSKQSKISDIKYSELKMQLYLAEGERDIRLTKLIFKARGRTLDIKMDKKWKYDDTSCSGCKINEETGEEIMRCKDLGDNDVSYKSFFEDLPEQVKAAKIHDKIRVEVT